MCAILYTTRFLNAINLFANSIHLSNETYDKLLGGKFWYTTT